ncbi:MAG: hypothetical protein IJ327_04165 [Lachnospiraceae bacterium]|nr:hypothetical protein [Lachnospiraceae bacterium]
MIIQMIYLGGLSIWDIREKKVPVSPLVAGGVLLMFLAIDRCLKGDQMWFTLLGGLLPGAILCLLAGITRKIGLADGVVVLALGAQYGLWGSLRLLFYSLVLLSAFSAFLIVLRKADSSTHIPYLPFLFVSYGVCVLAKCSWL